ncbi:uncharacterized protein MYCFIDRAFT_207141 [Pseudocercospora fijiensis CIRAD86]|uniref:Uncharacterized protein n=1 Tax=Pseudocercospora fijiensis (strain CIRAD86) TaxID=383855 RepID=M2Z2G2_PSEFD|nr:uncharacterized protein MYCFIDRAFT_207141 [Pseudocercospora fijiensis CIRAD86]EME84030.1 hypothetical protein MYCFIDRAFT_207141 [Pseudocercospora fijiensis CIRAD86]
MPMTSTGHTTARHVLIHTLPCIGLRLGMTFHSSGSHHLQGRRVPIDGSPFTGAATEGVQKDWCLEVPVDSSHVLEGESWRRWEDALPRNACKLEPSFQNRGFRNKVLTDPLRLLCSVSSLRRQGTYCLRWAGRRTCTERGRCTAEALKQRGPAIGPRDSANMFTVHTHMPRAA